MRAIRFPGGPGLARASDDKTVAEFERFTVNENRATAPCGDEPSRSISAGHRSPSECRSAHLLPSPFIPGSFGMRSRTTAAWPAFRLPAPL
jgi:hypothetical protein